jgi:hypothetical protein
VVIALSHEAAALIAGIAVESGRIAPLHKQLKHVQPS